MNETLNFKSFGSGRPVVIIHGLLGMLDNWLTFGKKLAESHLVFLVDLRNHGRSPHLSTMSYREMAEDLISFLDEQWLHNDVTLIGHSMGGKVAMQLALDHPDRLSNLFVIDIAPKTYAPSHMEIFSALGAVDLTTTTSRNEIEQTLLAKLGDSKVVGFLMKNLSRRPQGFRWKMNLEAIQRSYPAIIDNIEKEPGFMFTGSTCFYRGALSNYIEDPDIPLIKQYFPQMDLVTVPKAGHWIHADNLDFLLANVREKLALEEAS